MEEQRRRKQPLWAQIKAVLTIEMKTIFRQKIVRNSIIFQLVAAVFIPLIYSLAFDSELRGIYLPKDEDLLETRCSAADIDYTVAVAYGDATQAIGQRFARDHHANLVVSNSTNYMALEEAVRTLSSGIGVVFEENDRTGYVIADLGEKLMQAVQAVAGDVGEASETVISSMPLSQIEQAKDSYLYTAVLAIFLQYTFVSAIQLIVPYADSKVDKRTAVIVFNGGSIFKWDLIWLCLSALWGFIAISLAIAILAVCGQAIALVNPIIWLPEALLSCIQIIEYCMLISQLAKTKEQVQSFLGILIMLIFIPSALLIAVGNLMPNWSFIVLSFFPSFPFNQVMNMMCFAGFSSTKMTIGQMHNQWMLHWCLLVELAYCVIMYFVICKVDQPLLKSTCQVGIDYPAEYESVVGFFNKNVYEECQKANAQLLSQSPPSAVMFYNVSKKFGEVQANDGISLVIPENKITGILGPNGSGKTTLLNALFEAHRLDAGDVFINGVSVRKNPGSVGFCLEDNTALFEWLTVNENVAIYKAFASNPSKVEYFGLDPKEIANTLSGGMKRRLSLACSLVNKPKILVLDEPTAGVDPSGRKELWELIRNQSPTIISTTHMLDEASSYFDRVAFVMQGKLVCVGEVNELQGSGISCNVYGRLNDERYKRIGSPDSKVGNYRTEMPYSEVFDDLIARKKRGELQQFEINAESFDWIYLELSEHIWRRQ